VTERVVKETVTKLRAEMAAVTVAVEAKMKTLLQVKFMC